MQNVILFLILATSSANATVSVVQENGKFKGIENAILKSPEKGRSTVTDAQLDVCIESSIDSITYGYECKDSCSSQLRGNYCSLAMCELLCRTKFPQFCPSDQHEEKGYCIQNSIICSIENGTGTQIWNGTSYDSCSVTGCDPGFHIEGNDCVSDTRPCPIENGTGIETYLGSGVYSQCQVTECNPEFHIEGNACIPNEDPCVKSPSACTTVINGATYYKVFTAQQLTSLSSIGTALRKNVQLQADVDLAGIQSPNGYLWDQILSHFDGNGHKLINWKGSNMVGDVTSYGKVTNLTLQNFQVTTDTAAGLARNNLGVIDGLSVVGSNITGSSYASGVVYYNFSQIINTTVSGSSIKATSSLGKAGGLVLVNQQDGRVSGAKLENSTISGALNTAGIIAENSNSVDGATVVGSTITGSGSASYRIGGVVGISSLSTATVKNVYVSNSQISASRIAGGVIGSDITQPLDGAKIINTSVSTTSNGQLGCLAPANRSIISHAEVEGCTLTSAAFYGGALVGENYGTIKVSKVIGGTLKGRAYIGGIAGATYSSSTIVDSTVNGTSVTVHNDYSQGGGVAGYSESATISNASATAVKIYGPYTGGIVGQSVHSKILGCSTIDSEITGSWGIGGIVGNTIGSTNSVMNSTVTRTKILGGERVGGVAGEHLGGIIEGGSVNQISITGSPSGSVVGYKTSTSTVSNVTVNP